MSAQVEVIWGTYPRRHRVDVAHILAIAARSIWTLLVRAAHRHQNRRAISHLGGMPDYLIDDIGLTRADMTRQVMGR